MITDGPRKSKTYQFKEREKKPGTDGERPAVREGHSPDGGVFTLSLAIRGLIRYNIKDSVKNRSEQGKKAGDDTF